MKDRQERQFYAHSPPLGRPDRAFHDLHEHLIEVSKLASDFAASFGSSEWAALSGIWHDLGKYQAGFQAYIRSDADAHIEGARRRVTHSSAGALWAQEYLPEKLGPAGKVAARVLSYLIAGHHAGLADWHQGLTERLAGADACAEYMQTLSAQPPPEILKPAGKPLDLEVLRREQTLPLAFSMWIRMLFSCLVDADFLDTERYIDGRRSNAREGYLPIADLLGLFERYMDEKVTRLCEQGLDAAPINRIRAEVLRQCSERASAPPGVFTLTVPTGGGKTLSSLAFSLRHALRHGKRRIVYAIPYTSIIEQTASIFSGIFGSDQVVEHHSSIEWAPDEESSRSRLACENWDAPLIVTTNVQLFESLFASRTSRCRKLHNLVDSVIVLDEAQLLPVEFLQPILDALNVLVARYGVTVVLCTATQPALGSSQRFDSRKSRRGFDRSAEIIEQPEALYRTLRRVEVHRPRDPEMPQEWDEIARAVQSENAALAIVNRRQDARDLFRLLPAGTWHLSGLMCAQHRSDVIQQVKHALVHYWRGAGSADGLSPVRLVSTQLVEAGVDFDFPVVFRAMAGLDSIAQAAGRCNREGRLAFGQVHVFVPPTASPPGLLRQARACCKSVWHGWGGDPLDLELYERYFERLYGDQDLDKQRIGEHLRVGKEMDIAFRTAAERFRLVDDAEAATVFVRYQAHCSGDSIDDLLKKLSAEGPKRWLLRKFQRYGVTVYRHDLQRLLAQGDVREIEQGIYVQANDLLYDPLVGLVLDGAPGDPGSLYI